MLAYLQAAGSNTDKHCKLTGLAWTFHWRAGTRPYSCPHPAAESKSIFACTSTDTSS